MQVNLQLKQIENGEEDLFNERVIVQSLNGAKTATRKRSFKAAQRWTGKGKQEKENLQTCR